MTNAQYLIVYAQFSVIHSLYFMVMHALYCINTNRLTFTSTLLITIIEIITCLKNNDAWY